MDYARHINATKRSAHPYVDDYTGFTWNNIHSSRYNCFIENTGHLNFEPAPTFSNNFTNPMFQNRSYYTGMQTQTKKISLNLVFYQLTLVDLNEALSWLDRTVVSDLLLDYEPYWKYACKIASIDKMEKYVDGYVIDNGRKRDLYICKVPVTFETVYQTDAISIYTVFYSTAFSPYFYVQPTSGSTPIPFKTRAGQYFLTDEAPNVDRKMLQQYVAENYFDNNISWPLITVSSTESYTEITLRNPTPVPTYFKLHCYDISSSGLKLDYRPESSAEQGIDVQLDDITIAQAVLELDEGHRIHLHYNSEDGTLITANQIINNMQGYNRHNVCSFAQTLANIAIPPAQNGYDGILYLRLYGSQDWSLEYDLYNSMI